MNKMTTNTSIPIVECSTDINLKMKYGTPTYYFLCIQMSSIELNMVYVGDSFQNIVIEATKCAGGICKSDSEIIDFYTNSNIHMFFMSSYYDANSLSNPVKYYFDDNYYFDLTEKPYVRVLIDQIDLSLKNGTNYTLFETNSVLRLPSNRIKCTNNCLGLFEVQFSPKYYKIQEYQTYQPVFTRRLNNENKSEFLDKYASNLSESSNSSSTASSKITVEDCNTYYIFFVMAQIGGLYSFLKFSIGSIFSLITDKMLLISFINNLRQCKSNSKLNNLSKKKRSKRVLPTFNIEKVKPSSKASKQEEVKSPRPSSKKINRLEVNSQNSQSRAANYQEVNSKSNRKSSKKPHYQMSKYSSSENDIRYEFMDVVYMVLCLCKPSNQFDTDDNGIYDNRYLRFREDRKKIKKTLDITSILLSIRELKNEISRLKDRLKQISPESDSYSSDEGYRKDLEREDKKKENREKQNLNRSEEKKMLFDSQHEEIKESKKTKKIRNSSNAISKPKELNKSNSPRDLEINIKDKEAPKDSVKKRVVNIKRILSREIDMMIEEVKVSPEDSSEVNDPMKFQYHEEE